MQSHINKSVSQREMSVQHYTILQEYTLETLICHIEGIHTQIKGTK